MRIESEDDLLLVRLLMGAQPTLVMVAAAEAGIFDCLGERRISAAQVALDTGLDERATRLLLDSLVGLGVLKKNAADYSNTPISLRHLRVNTERSHAVRLWISETRQWEKLPEILRTGRNHKVSDETEAWRRGRSENHAFIRTMYDTGWLAAQAVAEAIDLSDVFHVVDLGGGPGHYAIAMLERSQTLRATVVDIPLSLMVAKESFKLRHLSDRVSLVACDIYESDKRIPIEFESAQLVLISYVVHMEGPQQNAELFRKATKLLSPGGRLIIHDIFLGEDCAHPQLSSLFAVHMLATTQRGELYPTSVIIGWLAAAGLHSRVLSTSPFLIEGVRPE